MLEDGVLDPEESKELMELLHKITDEKSEIGELTKTTPLPVEDPMPSIFL